MIQVKEAETIIDAVQLEWPVQEIKITEAAGKVLREPLKSDRDLPPFDRVMMDGIAIKYAWWEQGNNSFPVAGLQKAGAPQQTLHRDSHCLEVMTGAILPANTDTVIRYEDIEIQNKDEQSVARVNKGPKAKGQNIHAKGTNRKKDDELVQEGTVLGAAEIAAAATVGKSLLKVTRPPRVAVISTGDELVDIDQKPLPHQIRRSNSHALAAALTKWGIVAELFHLPDEKEGIFNELGPVLDHFDVIILSGGVSKGKLDYIPEILESRGVEKLFHKVRQRPGKPFWFGRSKQTVVFALPGNPVSTFMCYYRYIEPWLKKQLGMRASKPPVAQLAEDFSFGKQLACFLQVEVHVNAGGVLEAKPVKGKGSSDLSNLCRGDGFLELPESRDHFKAGESYPLYLYRDFRTF